jgi:uncharacterized membrane protein YqgA involved in biofilm formation
MNTTQNNWQLERRINVSAMVQVVMLAGLIVGSWVNLQRQLDLLGRDVRQVLAVQEKFCDKLETLHTKTIAHEIRIGHIEQQK